jgi:hypothetical protein
MADPKVGTGKKPKGSGRRLYTDENPRDTVGIKFATPADARATVAKVKRISKPFARKIQILTVGEQRAKVMGKNKVAAIETVITKLIKFLKTRAEALSISITSGSIDNMEKYRYIVGQIAAIEATLQELSNLLEDKEQNGKGTVINIDPKSKN